MGAVPKKKLTNRAQGNRAAHYAHAPVYLSPCPQCNSPRLPHRVCPNCGSYRGKKVIQTSTEQEA